MTASSSDQIVTYWIANGFPDAVLSFKLFTEKVFDYAVTEGSEFEIEDFYFENQINFYEFLCQRSSQRLMTGAEQYTFIFTINYYRTKSENTDGASWQSIRDMLDAAFPFAKALVGETWGGYVDFWRPQEEPAEIIEIDLAGEKVWKGTIQFFGTQTI